jgi:hypothetical protein
MTRRVENEKWGWSLPGGNEVSPRRHTSKIHVAVAQSGEELYRIGEKDWSSAMAMRVRKRADRRNLEAGRLPDGRAIRAGALASGALLKLLN